MIEYRAADDAFQEQLESEYAGEIAESRDHHPDMDIRWRTVTFRCSTHSAGGITALDLDLAKAISEQVDAQS